MCSCLQSAQRIKKRSPPVLLICRSPWSRKISFSRGALFKLRIIERKYCALFLIKLIGKLCAQPLVLLIAIDPKAGILKMGQKVFVEGYGYGECNDVGSAIKGWKIDLCFDTYEEAINWGRHLVKVWILKG